ncbi:MAG: hypothetical protein JWN34_2428 [Bryobacterales bacterium]|nr:hypothetical protein [Bryobacterales bacterium]
MPTASTPADPVGLTTAEAEARLRGAGANVPVKSRQNSALRELLAALSSPLVLILLFAAGMSAIVGERLDAFIIVTLVLIGVAVNFLQASRANEAAQKLQNLVSPTSTVRRDGEWQVIARSAVVPGDIIRLSAGDMVPADAQLISSRDLHAQESTLTGESLPAEKQPGPGREGSVFLGTSIVSGTAIAEVVCTGANTEFGAIADRLAARHPETEFERGLREFSYLIMRVTVFLVLFIVIVRVALHRGPLESILFAVALAVGMTPEFLPLITSITLAKGALRMARSGVIVRHLPAIQNLGAIDVMCSDKTGTLTTGKIVFESSLSTSGQPSSRPLSLAWWNSHFQTGVRSPLDEQIVAQPRPEGDWCKLDEVPFDFQRRRLSIAVESAVAADRLLITKGAPESILDVCTEFEDGATAQSCRTVYETLSAQGKRVIGVARKHLPEGTAWNAGDETGMTFVGFLVFVDPILPEAKSAVAKLKHDGVSIIILTGDSDLVAGNICGQLGLDHSSLLLGPDLDKMTDSALAHSVEHTAIFARVTPAQKTRIILALKRRGHVVGFMGDGINDAPSLHAADVGISVDTAVDVAREAADIILTRPGLGVLHAGIVEGRRAYGNILKYLFMGTSSNFGNMLSMAVASVALPFLPMLPTQILLNNFLYDLAQITIPTDNVDPELLRRPHRWDIQLIRRFMVLVGPVSSVLDLVTFYALLRVFGAGEELFHTGWFVESLTTQTLVLLVVRTMGNPLRSRPSLPLVISVLAIVALAFALPWTPLAAYLGLTPLPLPVIAFTVAVTAVYLVLVNLVKQRLMRSTVLKRRPA